MQLLHVFIIEVHVSLHNFASLILALDRPFLKKKSWEMDYMYTAVNFW